MSTTLQPQSPAVNYQLRDPVAIALAEELALKVSAAHQVLCGNLRYRVAAVARAFRLAREPVRLERWFEEIDAAREGFVAEPLTDTLIAECSLPDAEEELAEERFRLARAVRSADETAALADWIRKLDAQLYATRRLRLALRAYQAELLLDRSA